MVISNDEILPERKLPAADVVLEDGILRSRRHDDIYFSVDDGLAETRHVFLQGTNFLSRLEPHAIHHVLETGFGTGLNFLATWDAFRRGAPEGARLRYAAIEGYPLDTNIMSSIHDAFPELRDLCDQLTILMPPRWRGPHHLFFEQGRVELILLYGQVNAIIGRHDIVADTIFLDGFSPSKNADMWGEEMLTTLGASLAPGGRLATFTAAGHVRRSLGLAGLQVARVQGYGRKRDMTIAHREGAAPTQLTKRRVAVIGGGIAGVSVARSLQRLGALPTIHELPGGLGQGASGNRAGNQLPRLALDDGPAHRFARSAFAFARRETYASGSELGANGLHLATSDQMDERFKALAAQHWPSNYLQLLAPAEASDLLGFAHDRMALLHSWAGSVDVKDWLLARSSGVEVTNDKPDKAQEHVLAVGAGLPAMLQIGEYLPLQLAAGQISLMRHRPQSRAFNMALSYGGYFTPSVDSLHVFGATFEHDRCLDDLQPRTDGHHHNLDLMPQGLRQFLGDPDPVELAGRVSFRASTRDRMPAMGTLSPGRHVITGLGSRGLTYGPYLAYLLATRILSLPSFAELDVLEAVDWERFQKRDRKKGLIG